MLPVISCKCHIACIYITLLLSNAMLFHFIIFKEDAYRYFEKQRRIVKQNYFQKLLHQIKYDFDKLNIFRAKLHLFFYFLN